MVTRIASGALTCKVREAAFGLQVSSWGDLKEEIGIEERLCISLQIKTSLN